MKSRSYAHIAVKIRPFLICNITKTHRRFCGPFYVIFAHFLFIFQSNTKSRGKKKSIEKCITILALNFTLHNFSCFSQIRNDFLSRLGGGTREKNDIANKKWPVPVLLWN
jgi:hypothetical protein